MLPHPSIQQSSCALSVLYVSDETQVQFQVMEEVYGIDKNSPNLGRKLKEKSRKEMRKEQ